VRGDDNHFLSHNSEHVVICQPGWESVGWSEFVRQLPPLEAFPIISAIVANGIAKSTSNYLILKR